MAERILWIDTLRAIGIFFIVLIHTGRVHESYILACIKSWIVPLFFFVSGLLIDQHSYKVSFINFVKKLGGKLVVPYIFFSLIGYFYWLLLLRHFKNQPFDPFWSSIGILYGSECGNLLSGNSALWFFTCLFTIQVIFYSLFRAVHQKSNVFLLPICLYCLSIFGYIANTYILSHSNRLPWSIDIALTGTVFYGAGYLLQPYILTDLFMKWHWFGISTSLILCVFFSSINKNVDFYVGIYGNYFYFYISAFSGIFFWTYFARWVKPHRLVTAIGQNTLVIFSTHLLIIPCLTGFLVYGLRIPKQMLASGTFIALGYTIVTILLILPISILMNRYTPALVGKADMKIKKLFN
jgi:acyltransferase